MATGLALSCKWFSPPDVDHLKNEWNQHIERRLDHVSVSDTDELFDHVMQAKADGLSSVMQGMTAQYHLPIVNSMKDAGQAKVVDLDHLDHLRSRLIGSLQSLSTYVSGSSEGTGTKKEKIDRFIDYLEQGKEKIDM